MKKTRAKIFLVVTLFPLLVLFQNCGNTKLEPEDTDLDSNLNEEGSINFFKEKRPDLICGEEGYAFLMRNYITQNCSSCHTKGGFNDLRPLADTDLQKAFQSALGVNRDEWTAFTTANALCYPDCNLDKEGEVFKGIMEWYDNKVCP